MNACVCAGSCMTMYKFDEMPIGGKQELAVACGIKWNCKAECVQDFRLAPAQHRTK